MRRVQAGIGERNGATGSSTYIRYPPSLDRIKLIYTYNIEQEELKQRQFWPRDADPSASLSPKISRVLEADCEARENHPPMDLPRPVLSPIHKTLAELDSVQYASRSA